MRRLNPTRGLSRALLWVLPVLLLLGAGSSRKRREVTPKVEETVTDLAYISAAGELKLEGVGLVAGLDDTGADPPPSWYRQKLLDEMRKAGVEDANKLLADPRFSMVIVHAKIPTGTTTDDRIDVTLELPPASGTKSLAGGYLIRCRLKQVLVAGGTARESADLAWALGPVMTGSERKPDDVKAGRVLGGGRIKKDMPFKLIVKESRRSFRTSSLLESVVNHRFPLTEGVNQTGVTKAQTDGYLELKVPKVYHHNQVRYFRVVKLLPIVDTPALRVQRMVTWAKELQDPEKAGIAALRLEGLGPTAVDTLKTGLGNANSQVRFLAAEALAYLNDASGADVLAETVVAEPKFRAYALAALGACDQPTTRSRMIKLMDTADVEVRYGAFNALRTLDEFDPFLGRVKVLEEPPESELEDSETMSMAIAASLRAKKKVEDPFALYLVECDGPPMVHVANTRRCEIVIFGRSQKLLPPIVLGCGSILLNASDGDETLQISKIVPSRSGDLDTKIQATLELGDVVRQTANLGAKYPEIVSILQGASKQRNLPGPLVIDAVPGPNPAYNDAAIFGKDTTKKDKDVKRTKMENQKKPRFSFFGWFTGKDQDKDQDNK